MYRTVLTFSHFLFRFFLYFYLYLSTITSAFKPESQNFLDPDLAYLIYTNPGTEEY